MLVVMLVGVLGVVGSGLLGPPIVDIVYGAELSRPTMIALAVGSSCYMVAQATSQAVIALRGHALVALGWTGGMVAFIVTTAYASDDLFRRVEYGLVAGSAVAMVAFALAYRAKLAAGATVDMDSLYDALNERPLET